MDLKRISFRVRRIFAVYQAAVAGYCLVVPATRPGLFAALAAVHLAAAVLLWRGTPKSGAPVRRGPRQLLPWIAWLACWLELGWLIRFSGLPMNDAGVMAADLAVFGAHAHLLLAQRLPTLTEAMDFFYLSYYALVLGPPLVLALRRRYAESETYTRAVIATYLVCYFFYLVFPVLGPRALAALHGTAAAAGPGGLEEFLRVLGDSPGTAFPSSHCAGAWAAALAAGALVSGPVRALLFVWAALVTLSTVHTGNHYAIDAAAGILVAFAVRPLVTGFRPVLAFNREVRS